MKDNKTYKKKLTEAGSGVCFLALIAVIVSAMGIAMEFLGTIGYNHYDGVNESHVFASDIYDYIFKYDKAIITFLLSLVVLFVFLIYRRKKKIGAEFSILLIVASCACAVKPIAFLVYALSDNDFLELLKDTGDSRSFVAVMELLVYILPLVSCLFLAICGIVIALKLIKENFRAEVPYVEYEKPEKENKKTEKADDLTTDDKKPADEVKPEFEFENSNFIPPVAEKKAEPEAVADKKPESVKEAEKPAVSVCKKCGKPVKDGSKFCEFCGEKI